MEAWDADGETGVDVLLPLCLPEALAWPPTEWVSVMFGFGGDKKHHDTGNEGFFFILHPSGMIGLIPSAWAPRNGQ